MLSIAVTFYTLEYVYMHVYPVHVIDMHVIKKTHKFRLLSYLAKYGVKNSFQWTTVQGSFMVFSPYIPSRQHVYKCRAGSFNHFTAEIYFTVRLPLVRSSSKSAILVITLTFSNIFFCNYSFCRSIDAGATALVSYPYSTARKHYLSHNV